MSLDPKYWTLDANPFLLSKYWGSINPWSERLNDVPLGIRLFIKTRGSTRPPLWLRRHGISSLHPYIQLAYNVSHLLDSKNCACLLSELATGWMAGFGAHSALSRLASQLFIYEQGPDLR